jgi:predicted metal-dependent phosphoesterase TrpH
VYAVDLHSHTRFFHGRRALGDRFDPLGFRLLAATARARGLDGLATTNHDYYTPFESDDPTVIPGIEVSTTRGHVLVVGPDPPAETEPGELTPAEAVEMAHDRDCAAVMAHPFRGDLAGADADFDAVELNGKHPRSHPWALELARRRDLPVVGGSDAHYPVEVGRAYTRVDAPELTPEAVVAAVREGRVSARVRHGGTDRAVRQLYRAIHDHNDRLTRPSWADDLDPDPERFPGLDARWEGSRGD